MIERKAQSSLEFVMLVSFVLLIAGVFLVVVQKNLLSAQEERDEALVGRVMNILNSEILFAQQSSSGYKRTFYIPTSLDGIEYDINASFDGSGTRQDVVVSFKDRNYVFFLESNAAVIQNPELLHTGDNTISKECDAFTCSLILENNP